MFFPSGGGLDLVSAKFSNEKDCIELIAEGTVNVVKPKKLTFESFGFNYKWNYFRLETYELKKSNVYDDYSEDSIREELTEIAPAVYADHRCFKYNDLNGLPLPDGARPICRFFRGSFVFFQKTSIYNKTPSTYSATHEKMTEPEFRKMIQKAAKLFHKEDTIVDPEIGAELKTVKSTSWKSYSGSISIEEVNMIKKTIELSMKVSKEYELLSETMGDDLSKWYKAEEPEKKKLNEFLNTLGKEELLLIEGVMYAGRDYTISGMVHPLENYIQIYEEGTADNICSKAPLAKYLSAGLKVYR